jgi:hypothetical protein
MPIEGRDLQTGATVFYCKDGVFSSIIRAQKDKRLKGGQAL